MLNVIIVKMGLENIIPNTIKFFVFFVPFINNSIRGYYIGKSEEVKKRFFLPMEINLKNNLITDIIFAGISGVILLGFNFLNSREEIISLREILPYYLSGCFTGLVFSSFTTTITNLLYKEKRNSIRDFLPYL